jgi:hypothetical protein
MAGGRMSSIWSRIDRERYDDDQQWVVSIGDRDHVAQSTAELRSWIAARRFTPAHLVYDARIQRWVRASEVPELADLCGDDESERVPKTTIALVAVTIAAILILVGLVIVRENLRASRERRDELARREAEQKKLADEARRREIEQREKTLAYVAAIRAASPGDFTFVSAACSQLGEGIPSDLAARCRTAQLSFARQSLQQRDVVSARAALSRAIAGGASGPEVTELEERIQLRETQEERKRAADAARAESEEREKRATAEILARRVMGELLRERYLDAGANIKVVVSGKRADRIKLTWVLFNDVWSHRFQKDGVVNNLCGAGFTRVEMSDGYDWGVYWTCQ